MNDKIYKTIEHQAKLKCGRLWLSMNDKERNSAMLKSAITIIKQLSEEVKND